MASGIFQKITQHQTQNMLTKDQIKQNAEVMQDCADGIEIEYKNRHADESQKTWCTWLSATLNPKDFIYRRKPAPKTRPWNCPDDVPLNCWIRGNDMQFRWLSGADVEGIYVSMCANNGIDVLFKWGKQEGLEHSTDRREWKPCVTEEQ